MTTFSSSAKPLGFYAEGEPLTALTETYGARLEGMTRYEKFILLGVIASKFAFDDADSLNENYQFAPPLVHVADFVPVRIDADIVALEELSEDALLGLCEALVAQLRYSKEVAS
jgi:hypothetical protein